MNHNLNSKVWLITGTSSGLGRCLVYSVLSRGDFVIATARSLGKIKDFPPSNNLRLLQIDVDSSIEIITAKINEALTFWGRIDILVNNAGFSLGALFEEAGSEQFKRQYQTNVFGLIDMTTAVLPHMRERRSGTLVMIGSRLSWSPENPASSLYTSSKAAVRTFSETLAVELEEFGLRVLIVEPGDFRTEGILSTPFYLDNQIPDYDGIRKKAIERVDPSILKGDPAKGMEILTDVVRGEGKAKGMPWPLYLIMGPGAEVSVRGKCEKILTILDNWKDVIKDMEIDG